MPSAVKWAIAVLLGLAIIVVGWKWAGWLLTSFFVMNCLVLIIVVLLQSGKAADLAGAFGGSGSQTAFGPRGAATFLSKATTWCFVMFLLTTVSMTIRQTQGIGRATGSSVLEKTQKPAEKTPTPFGAPVTPVQGQPTPAPPQQQQQAPPPAQPPAKK